MDPGERFVNLRQFANEIVLGKYVMSHRYDIEQATGLQITREDKELVLIIP
jgi:hypothetical protein